MRILSITAQKPHSTGSGTYLTELVRSWDEAGHRQAVVCGIHPEDVVSFPDGVACYPVFFTDTAADSVCAGNDLPFPITGMSDIMPYTSTRYRDLTPEMIDQFESSFIAAVSEAVAALDPELIVCHHLFLLTAMVRKHFPDRKIYGISHGTDLRQMINVPHLAEMIRPQIAGLDGLLALHEEQRSRIIELFGDEHGNGSDGNPISDRARVIGSGYNDRLFNAGPRHSRRELEKISEMDVPVMICYAGKMSRPKGVPELLQALDKLAADPDVPPFEVTLAGGCQDDHVRELLGKTADNINWVGQIPQTRLADIFRFCDIFVLPSYFEGLPLVLIEAMASGMIPVSTDLPGVRNWIEANVPDHNIRFIEMPEMAAIDQPTESGREKFKADLTETLSGLIKSIYSSTADRTIPDTSGITWSSVAARVLQ